MQTYDFHRNISKCPYMQIVHMSSVRSLPVYFLWIPTFILNTLAEVPEVFLNYCQLMIVLVAIF